MTRMAEIPGTGLAVFMTGVESKPREVPTEAVFLNQVHGAEVLDHPEPYASADGMVVPRDCCHFPGVLTADCLPVFAVWDHAVGCAHAGWRGLAAGVLEALLQTGGGPPLAVLLGPCICGECYTVGDGVRSLLGGAGPPGRIDLKEIAAARLGCCGSIYTVNMCTLCGTGFHSHRRNGTTLRNRFWLAPGDCGRDITHSVPVKKYDNFTFGGSSA